LQWLWWALVRPRSCSYYSCSHTNTDATNATDATESNPNDSTQPSDAADTCPAADTHAAC